MIQNESQIVLAIESNSDAFFAAMRALGIPQNLK